MATPHVAGDRRPARPGPAGLDRRPAEGPADLLGRPAARQRCLRARCRPGGRRPGHRRRGSRWTPPSWSSARCAGRSRPTTRSARTLTYTQPGRQPGHAAARGRAWTRPSPHRGSARTELVVPANGQASVTVTVNRGAGGAGMFSGRITATAAGSDPLVTTIGWYAEPESYDLTVKGINRDGSAATADSPSAGPTAGPRRPRPDRRAVAGRHGRGPAPRRAPTTSRALVRGRRRPTNGWSSGPRWTAGTSGSTKDRTVVLDARDGRPVDVSVRGRRRRECPGAPDVTSGRTRRPGPNGNGVRTTGVPRQFFAVSTDQAGDSGARSSPPALGRNSGRSARPSPADRRSRWPTSTSVPGSPAPRTSPSPTRAPRHRPN